LKVKLKKVALAMIAVVPLLFASPVHAAKQCGSASWYSLHGNKTASGEKMNQHGMTAAHKSLRFGTKIRVTNMKNGKTVIVRINDRGPFIKGRTLDLAKGAANKIGMLGSGHARVCYEKV
jgi:rare lipoprotein A